MAHPDGLLLRKVVEELRLRRLELRLAELRGARALDCTTEISGHELHAVTDPESRDAQGEDRLVDQRRTFGIHGRRPTGEHERSGVPSGDLGGRQAMAHELRVDARLANAPRDQLAVLASEINHEDRPLLRSGLGDRKRDRLCRFGLGHQLRR